MPAPETRRFLTPRSGLDRSSQLAQEGNRMESNTTHFDGVETSLALPTTFIAAEESAVLTKMLELELEQASQVAGGLMSAVRCCAVHCCSCHC
jgi:hypothetical protein